MPTVEHHAPGKPKTLADKLRCRMAARAEEPVEIISGSEAAWAERQDFEAGFERRPNGNLVSIRDRKILTVFRRGEGLYSWSIADSEGTRFSRGTYESEGDAIGGLAGELEVGLW